MVAFSKRREQENLKGSNDKRSIILHNDDVNTFEHVIETLCEVCNHDFVQAEQCALITHYKGSCQIKSGQLEELIVLKDQLLSQNLSVSID